MKNTKNSQPINIFNQVDLFYKISGKGRLLILLHGFGLNLTIWEKTCSHLPAGIQCIMPDLRGHGKSLVPPGIYSMDDMAADVLGMMDSLKIEKATIAGHSMGGYIALAFAQRYPDRLVGLGLITTNARPDPPEKRDGRIMEMHRVRLKGSSVLADSLAPRLTKSADLENSVRSIINATNPQGIVGASLGMAERLDRMDVLRRLNCPVLVVAGSEDLITPLAVCEEMALNAPNGKLVIIKGAGHLPMLEEPKILATEFSKMILSAHF